MATKSELREYAESLKPIYQEIFKEIAKRRTRRRGQGEMMKNLAFPIAQRGHFNPEEVMEACRRLEEQGDVEINSRGFVIPTERGEKIISILTGNPELPTDPF